jgi:hypothetical protein
MLRKFSVLSVIFWGESSPRHRGDAVTNSAVYVAPHMLLQYYCVTSVLLSPEPHHAPEYIV